MQPGAAPKEPPLQGSRLAVAAYVGSSKRDIPDADITASRPVRCNALLDRWTFPIPAPAPGTPQPDPEPPQMRTPHRPPLSP